MFIVEILIILIIILIVVEFKSRSDGSGFSCYTDAEPEQGGRKLFPGNQERSVNDRICFDIWPSPRQLNHQLTNQTHGVTLLVPATMVRSSPATPGG